MFLKASLIIAVLLFPYLGVIVQVFAFFRGIDKGLLYKSAQTLACGLSIVK